jgi:hypothetical protein
MNIPKHLEYAYSKIFDVPDFQNLGFFSKT